MSRVLEYFTVPYKRTAPKLCILRGLSYVTRIQLTMPHVMIKHKLGGVIGQLTNAASAARFLYTVFRAPVGGEMTTQDVRTHWRT